MLLGSDFRSNQNMGFDRQEHRCTPGFLKRIHYWYMWQTSKNHKIDLFSPFFTTFFFVFQRNRKLCGEKWAHQSSGGHRFTEKASVSCQMMLADYMQSPHKVCIFDVLDKLEQGVTHRCKIKASNCDNIWLQKEKPLTPRDGLVLHTQGCVKSHSLEKLAHGSGNFDLFTGKSSKQHAWGSGVPLPSSFEKPW